MQFRGGMNELMRQASRIQRKIEETKAKIKDNEVVGAAGGDKVKVTVTYEGKLKHISIDPELLQSEGIEMALDMVVAAANNALDAADKQVEAEINKITGGVKLPGMG